jgi:hypothetical protein
MISFIKWLEFSDMGGEVSYNHQNNVVANDNFGKIRSKWMTSDYKKTEPKKDIDKIFGKKNNKKMINKA